MIKELNDSSKIRELNDSPKTKTFEQRYRICSNRSRDRLGQRAVSRKPETHGLSQISTFQHTSTLPTCCKRSRGYMHSGTTWLDLWIMARWMEQIKRLFFFLFFLLFRFLVFIFYAFLFSISFSKPGFSISQIIKPFTLRKLSFSFTIFSFTDVSFLLSLINCFQFKLTD